MHGTGRPAANPQNRPDDALAAFMRCLRRNGLKQTEQRTAIWRVFTGMGGHPSPEELHEEVRRRGHNPSLATIYRTLKLFLRAGLARKLEFGDGLSRYEPLGGIERPHLHLVCERCGRTLEVSASDAGRLYRRLASDLSFTMHRQTTYVYGLCEDCARDARREHDDQPPKDGTRHVRSS